MSLSAADEPASPPRQAARPIMVRMRPILRTFWRDLSYHLVGLPATILAFAVVVAGLTVALTALGLIVGIPLIAVAFAVFRWNARLERRRTAWALGAPVPEAYRPRTGNSLRRLRIVASDPQSWKDLAWLAFAGTFGFAASVFAITARVLAVATYLRR